MDFQQALHDYCTWHHVCSHSPRTVEWYQHKLGLFHAWLQKEGRSTHVDAITIADARDFILAEQQRDVVYRGHPALCERMGKLSDRTIDSYVCTIRAFWRWMVEEEYLTRNVMAKLKRPKLEVRYKQVLDENEVARLLALCNQRTFLGARLYALIALLYDSGLRASEVVQLNVDDVDLRAYQVRVVRGKGKKERLVPFGLATCKALRKISILRSEFVDAESEAFFVGKDR